MLDPNRVDEALRDVAEVYHLAGLPGMWIPKKEDFYAVNCHGTEIVIVGCAQARHCALPALLDRIDPFPAIAIDRMPPSEHSLLPAQEMPGLYTRSKMLAEQFAAQAAASGFPLVIGTPTMPIGPHDHNLTPPTAMLRHFLSGRVQLYLDFIVNLVDVRDVAAGLILAMEHGQIGHRYILGGESISLKKILQLMATISGRRYVSIPVPGRVAEMSAAMLEFISDHVTHRPPSGTAEGVRIALRATELSIEKAQASLAMRLVRLNPRCATRSLIFSAPAATHQGRKLLILPWLFQAFASAVQSGI